MLSKELIEQVESQYVEAFRKFQVSNPRLLPSQGNFEVVVKFLRGEELPEASWSTAMFTAALVELVARGALELAPTEEEKAAARERKRREFAANDRKAGDPHANRKGTFVSETPADIREKTGKFVREERDAYSAKVKKELEDAAAREAAERDLSNVPTLKSILESGAVELPTTEQKAMTVFQLREYRRRLNAARMEIHARTRPRQ